MGPSTCSSVRVRSPTILLARVHPYPMLQLIFFAWCGQPFDRVQRTCTVAFYACFPNAKWPQDSLAVSFRVASVAASRHVPGEVAGRSLVSRSFQALRTAPRFNVFHSRGAPPLGRGDPSLQTIPLRGACRPLAAGYGQAGYFAARGCGVPGSWHDAMTPSDCIPTVPDAESTQHASLSSDSGERYCAIARACAHHPMAPLPYWVHAGMRVNCWLIGVSPRPVPNSLVPTAYFPWHACQKLMRAFVFRRRRVTWSRSRCPCIAGGSS